MRPTNRIKVELNRDYTVATVFLVADASQVKPTPDELRAEIEAAGVLHGIREEALLRAVEAPFGTKVVVAEGDPAVPGQDARIEIKVEGARKAPRERENGSVDYRDLQMVRNVVKGQVLAEKIPAVPGKPGMDVRGVPYEPEPVKDVLLPAGRNTAVTPDGMKLIALIDGHLVVERDPRGKVSLHVDEIFTLKGSVDMSVGNLDCIGGCCIHGNVNDGFVVEANGDILIKGEAAGARIVSRNGSVTIEGGIKGHNKGEIVAKKNLYTKFIENARVETGGDVCVTEHLYHSRIYCRGSVVMKGEPGVIMGGEITFVGKLSAIQLGTEAEPKTRVYFGDWISAQALKRIKEIDELLVELGQQAEEMRKTLIEMRRLSLEDPEKHKDLIAGLAQSAASFPRTKARMDELEKEKDGLWSRVSRSTVSPVAEILGKMHPGVLLSGEGAEDKPVRKLAAGVRIVLKPGEKGENGFSIKSLR